MSRVQPHVAHTHLDVFGVHQLLDLWNTPSEEGGGVRSAACKGAAEANQFCGNHRTATWPARKTRRCNRSSGLACPETLRASPSPPSKRWHITSGCSPSAKSVLTICSAAGSHLKEKTTCSPVAKSCKGKKNRPQGESGGGGGGQSGSIPGVPRDTVTEGLLQQRKHAAEHHVVAW